MAKKETKRAAAGRPDPTKRTKSRPAVARKPGGKGSGSKRASAGAGRRPQSGKGAADALVDLLESPLVAEVIAAGAAAALAAITQQALTKKSGGGTKAALKEAAKAAATAMGTRLATEFDEIMKSAKAKAKAGES